MRYQTFGYVPPNEVARRRLNIPESQRKIKHEKQQSKQIKTTTGWCEPPPPSCDPLLVI